MLSNVEANSEPWTWEAAQELCLRLESEYEELRTTDRKLALEREAALAKRPNSKPRAGLFHPELLRLRDELDAELLVQRFDDIEPGRAAELEARLGPLLNALVVSDPEAVATTLVGRPRELESVWLVASDAQFSRIGDGSGGARRGGGARLRACASRACLPNRCSGARHA